MSLSAFSRPRDIRPRRASSLLAVAALTLALTLGGCRGGTARNNSVGAPAQGAVSTATSASGSSSSPASGSSNASTLQQLENLDSQSQSATQGMNTAQNNAGANYSSQETNQVP